MIASFGTGANAQTAGELMQMGDAAAESLRPQEALRHYEAIVASDSGNFEALWKASMNAIDLGEFEEDAGLQEELYRKGEKLARRAVVVKPNNAEAHFHLARSLGVSALSVGVKQRVNYAREVREHALLSLKYHPDHAGALHVLGVWHAEVMRLSFAERLLARAFLGAGFFSQASWEEATTLLERSAAVDPDRLTHHLDLARIYRDRKMTDKARAAYQKVIDGKPVYCNDTDYKRLATAELARLK